MVEPDHPHLRWSDDARWFRLAATFCRAPAMETAESRALMPLLDKQLLETPWYARYGLCGSCVGRGMLSDASWSGG